MSELHKKTSILTIADIDDHDYGGLTTQLFDCMLRNDDKESDDEDKDGEESNEEHEVSQW